MIHSSSSLVSQSNVKIFPPTPWAHVAPYWTLIVLSGKADSRHRKVHPCSHCLFLALADTAWNSPSLCLASCVNRPLLFNSYTFTWKASAQRLHNGLIQLVRLNAYNSEGNVQSVLFTTPTSGDELKCWGRSPRVSAPGSTLGSFTHLSLTSAEWPSHLYIGTGSNRLNSIMYLKRRERDVVIGWEEEGWARGCMAF